MDGYPQSFLNKSSRCPMCTSNRKKTDNEFVKEVFDLVGDEYTFIDTYVDNSTKLKVKHNVCGRIYEITPNMFLSRQCKCECCAYIDINRKSNEQFLLDLYDVWGDEYAPLEEYKYALEKIAFRHKTCGRVVYGKPNTLLNGSGCCDVCKNSKGEKTISRFLDDNLISYESQKTYNKLVGVKGSLLRYDFYLNDYNILIEYQGQFHDGTVSHQTEEELKRQKEHDRRKKEYCLKNKIPLLEIWYWDFDNIEDILRQELNICNIA